MSTIPVKVVARTADEVWVQPLAGCGTCATACHSPRMYRLDSTAGNNLVVHVSPLQHAALAFHSLMLPLLGFVGGAALASLASASDLVALGASFTGLLVGVLVCRTLPADTINVYEASPNE